MTRNIRYRALALRVRAAGENREASFLTPEEGIIRATVFGGPKSRLRAHVSPFNSGVLWIYRDPAKDFRKVSDFDVADWRPGIRELYERSEAATEIAAAVLASSGSGGAWEEAFALACGTLDALQSADEACCVRLVIRFLWNWAGIAGEQPALERCSGCGREVSSADLMWFKKGEGLLCADCAKKPPRLGEQNAFAGSGIAVGGGARRWLAAVENAPAQEVKRTSLDAESLREAKALFKALSE
jgi:DNA repair protein RecO (recombination protein O)